MELAAIGLPMTKAGPPPLLKNVILGLSTAQLDGPSSSAGNMPNLQEGKSKQHRVSIDSLWEDALDPEGVEYETDSEPWSAQDESDG
jgi:hypothetical protein